ncbi:MAG TPA: hypothetical protein VMS73_07965 [Anaerolineaceae bacterium]|nr:hypothetical protein [Anaerolineaceae bacterium]
MGHQPFETWLLEEQDLSPAQRQELNAHLDACPQCYQLKESLEAAVQMLKATPFISPRPGFTERWKISQAERRSHQHRRQTRLFFLSSIAGAVVCLSGLYAILRMSNFSIADLLVFLARVATGIIGFFNQAQVFLLVNLSSPLSIVFWILISSGFCLLVLGWIYMLWRISFRGVLKNEKSE